MFLIVDGKKCIKNLIGMKEYMNNFNRNDRAMIKYNMIFNDKSGELREFGR